MKNLFGKILVTVAGSLLISFGLTLFFGGFSILNYVNNVFLVSLALLMIGGIFYVLQTGFFNGIVYSFRRFIKSTQKRKMIEDDEQEIPYFVDYTFPFTYAMIIAGGALFLISIFIGFSMI
ncbi:DUF3899 domain-containing protein [Pseudalkalibacillus caeni]|uniref:DUF3899 domain-containing protein n=1 Tax=Exobacillus caeni TaxID=2574798 RepID=A0A5R9FAC6_9BACL|nr:DUF3899 domain-containing protein [Pseudalkalibacillus caeni]TLS37813.1 DUF3899 domain-containing protein [Pseudalkalibacillus caeni]